MPVMVYVPMLRPILVLASYETLLKTYLLPGGRFAVDVVITLSSAPCSKHCTGVVVVGAVVGVIAGASVVAGVVVVGEVVGAGGGVAVGIAVVAAVGCCVSRGGGCGISSLSIADDNATPTAPIRTLFVASILEIAEKYVHIPISLPEVGIGSNTKPKKRQRVRYRNVRERCFCCKIIIGLNKCIT